MAAAGVYAFALAHPLVHRSASSQAAIEAVLTVMTLISGGLFAAQFIHVRRLRKLLLLCALLILAMAELVGLALPAALEVRSPTRFMDGVQIAYLFAAALFGAAAFTPSNRLIAGRPGRHVAVAAAGALAAFAAAQLMGMLLHGELLGRSGYSGPQLAQLSGRPLGLLVLLPTLVCYGYALITFATQGRQAQDRSLWLLGSGIAVLCAAQLYSLRLPPSTMEALSLRDALAALGFGLLLGAAVREDLVIRRALTRAAAVAERRRVAQDLHDGLAQDLALIAAHGDLMARELGAEHPVTVAARRALSLSRETISELADLSSTPPAEALQAIAHDLRARFGVSISVDASESTPLGPDASDHLARITREAVANAVRHGGARNVLVSLRQTRLGVSLRVCDDGSGPTRLPAPESPWGHFGLRDMRERAAMLGGHLEVRERKHGGTELRVVLP